MDEAPLRDATKKIGPANGALGKKLAAKDATAAADDKELATWFATVQKFWKSRKAADAVGFVKSAGSEYKMVAKLAAAHKKIGANCKGCHEMQRKKAPDGARAQWLWWVPVGAVMPGLSAVGNQGMTCV